MQSLKANKKHTQMPCLYPETHNLLAKACHPDRGDILPNMTGGYTCHLIFSNDVHYKLPQYKTNLRRFPIVAHAFGRS